MPKFLRTRLSAMMFLFYFALGSWAVTLSTYLMSAPSLGGLNFTTAEVGWIYSTFAFGGMAAPLVIGLLADRLFRAERVLGVSSLGCAVMLTVAGWWCDANFARITEVFHTVQATVPVDSINDDPMLRQVVADVFWPLFGMMLVYSFCLQLGLTLTTVITLRNLHDPGRGFSRMRMWGTIGWIVTGNVVGILLVPVSPQPLYLAALASGLLGIYAFTLPATRPKGFGKSVAQILGLPALKLFKDRSFGIFVGVAFMSTAMNQFYGLYAHRYLTDLGVPKPEQVLTLGQVCEVVCMFLIPLLHPKKHLKTMMLVGLAGWVVRGFALTYGSVPIVLMFGVPMHGWSYAFFFVVAATYLDREAPPHLRASAQGIISFVSSGFGNWIGNTFAGYIVEQHKVGNSFDWQPIWFVPLLGCSISLLIFFLFFQPPPDKIPSKAH